ncbi:hypothetical protein [Clavibacter tessellarius]|uniref:hypothetical protein n=1 Tax=Clavibacter tessellarius TaxID=31965 RepID=UPI003247EC65
MTSNIRKDRMRPAELLGIAAALAAFVGLIVALSTRPADGQGWTVVVVFTGVAFIGALVMLAMLALSFKPNRDEPPGHGRPGPPGPPDPALIRSDRLRTAPNRGRASGPRDEGPDGPDQRMWSTSCDASPA